jgi:transposase-like protein
MRKTTKSPGEKVVKDIKRATRKQYSSEEKIRIVLDGLRGEDSIAELCRREGISQGVYYKWSKDFMEAGKKRLAGNTARVITTDRPAGSLPMFLTTTRPVLVLKPGTRLAPAKAELAKTRVVAARTVALRIDIVVSCNSILRLFVPIGRTRRANGSNIFDCFWKFWRGPVHGTAHCRRTKQRPS